MAWRWSMCLFLSWASSLGFAEENSINRSQAAQIAQKTFGGKVLSVDELEPGVPSAEQDDTPPHPGTRFVVKLMQGGRVRVVNLDAQGTPLTSAQ